MDSSGFAVDQNPGGFKGDPDKFRSVKFNEPIKTNLIVNYLPDELSESELFCLFAPHGVVTSVLIMRSAESGYSRGYGFVDFLREQDAEKAIAAMNGRAVGNKRLKVSFACPSSSHANVFVTHLPKTVTQEELICWFKPYGKIVDTNILVDGDSKVPCGSAFVRFEQSDGANSATLGLSDFIPPGASTRIRVRLARDRSKKKAPYFTGLQDATNKVNRQSNPVMFN